MIKMCQSDVATNEKNCCGLEILCHTYSNEFSKFYKLLGSNSLPIKSQTKDKFVCYAFKITNLTVVLHLIASMINLALTYI